jgi:hypothetical protein
MCFHIQINFPISTGVINVKPIENIVLAALLHDVKKACQRTDELFEMIYQRLDNESTDNWQALARDYHSTQSRYHELIDAADHFASTERQEGQECLSASSIESPECLSPILKRVSLNPQQEEVTHTLPPLPLELTETSIFPRAYTDSPENYYKTSDRLIEDLKKNAPMAAKAYSFSESCPHPFVCI